MSSVSSRHWPAGGNCVSQDLTVTEPPFCRIKTKGKVLQAGAVHCSLLTLELKILPALTGGRDAEET